VLAPNATPEAVAELRAAFDTKVDEIATFMGKSLPSHAWGAGRLDAFGMIFNRVTALDLAIPANYSPADAPVRYPFLWNAPLQDATQWDGAAPNGNFVKGLARNTGEVFGVFGKFTPSRPVLAVRYASSANFANLQLLEKTITALKPPPWPDAIPRPDDSWRPRGAALFAANCASCHGKQASQSVPGSWATPVCRVGTDGLMFDRAKAKADSGILAGTPQLGTGGLLGEHPKKLDILANAVIGSLAADIGADTGLARAVRADLDELLDFNRPGLVRTPGWTLPDICMKAPPRRAVAAAPAVGTSSGALAVAATASEGLYQLPTATGPAPDEAAYEARVMDGIWAAAPYLHNGSVPNLWQLLTPPGDRVKSFPTGLREFDPVDVGVAVTPASPGDYDTRTPGNSNAGHDYGTSLPESDRRALIAYLKML
jgi:hypothetical protein